MLLSPLRKTAKTSLHPFPIGIRSSLHLFRGTLNLSSLYSAHNLRSPRRSTLAVHDEWRSLLPRPLLYSRNLQMPLDGGQMSSCRIRKCGGRRQTIGPLKWRTVQRCGREVSRSIRLQSTEMTTFAITDRIRCWLFIHSLLSFTLRRSK